MALMAQTLKFDFIVNRNNIESFAEETYWHECALLNLSLALCGLAQKIKNELSPAAPRAEFLTKFSKIIESQGSSYALSHDFEQGEGELLAFIEHIKTQAEDFFTPP